MLTIPFPDCRPVHHPLVYIHDRGRYSSMTSVRFVAADRFVACDFAARLLYLVAFDRATGAYTLLDQITTIGADGASIETDLMDYDGEGLIVVSNFKGSQSFYRVADDRVTFVRELTHRPAFPQCHGVRFLSGGRLGMTFNWKRAPLWQITTMEGRVLQRVTCRAQPQDLLELEGGQYLVAARSDHISQDGVAREPVQSTLYLYQDRGRREPARIDRWVGHGHLDTLCAYNGRIYATDQYRDRVAVFEVQDNRIRKLGVIDGFTFPHGMDIAADGLMAVTNYGDGTVRLLELEAA